MTTPSEDKLYLTDDLKGRLGELTEADGEGFYVDDGPQDAPATPQPIKACVSLVFEDGHVETVFGDVQSVSFGEGWLCAITTPDPVMPVIRSAAKGKVEYVRVTVDDVSYDMMGKLDFAVTFFAAGLTSFTVTSDEARYV